MATIVGTDEQTGFIRIALEADGDSFIDTNSDPSIIAGNDGDDDIDGGGGADFILGNRGNDTIDGGNGRDVLFGGRGDDNINGGSGRDFISGDFGTDTLRGGSGADTFYFNSRTTDAVDTITDYSLAEGDKILIDGFESGMAVAVTGGTEIYADGNLIAFLDGYTGQVNIQVGAPDYSDYTAF